LNSSGLYAQPTVAGGTAPGSTSSGGTAPGSTFLGGTAPGSTFIGSTSPVGGAGGECTAATEIPTPIGRHVSPNCHSPAAVGNVESEAMLSGFLGRKPRNSKSSPNVEVKHRVSAAAAAAAAGVHASDILSAPKRRRLLSPPPAVLGAAAGMGVVRVGLLVRGTTPLLLLVLVMV
jgi:hypothetical protein